MLSIIECDILTVLVNTITSETACSVGGRVVSERLCSLFPKTIEVAICLKD